MQCTGTSAQECRIHRSCAESNTPNLAEHLVARRSRSQGRFPSFAPLNQTGARLDAGATVRPQRTLRSIRVQFQWPDLRLVRPILPVRIPSDRHRSRMPWHDDRSTTSRASGQSPLRQGRRTPSRFRWCAPLPRDRWFRRHGSSRHRDHCATRLKHASMVHRSNANQVSAGDPTLHPQSSDRIWAKRHSRTQPIWLVFATRSTDRRLEAWNCSCTSTANRWGTEYEEPASP